MNVFELMDSKASSFSKTDRAIYESIKKFPGEFAYNSISEICEGGQFTKSALTRFAQKLGFAGYVEFQYQFQQDLKSYRNDSGSASSAEIYAKVIMQVNEAAERDRIRALIQKMRSMKRVLILGTNLSRLPAEELLITLTFEHDIVSMIPPADIMPFSYNSDDMILVYSALSGSSYQSLMQTVRKSGDNKPYMVLVPVNAKHPLRHNFDEVFVLPGSTMADSAGHTVLSDTFAFLMFNDILTKLLDKS